MSLRIYVKSILKEVLSFDFGEFAQFLKAEICQNQNSEPVNEIVKMSLFEILNSPKLISCKFLSDSKITNCVYTFFQNKIILDRATRSISIITI